jgi:hypothetical protein
MLFRSLLGCFNQQAKLQAKIIALEFGSFGRVERWRVNP